MNDEDTKQAPVVPEVLLPTPDLLEQSRFNAEVSDSLGNAHARLASLETTINGPKVKITGAAAAMLQVMLLKSEKGSGDKIWELAAFAAQLPDFTEQELKDGAGELEFHGLVTPLRAIGHAVRLRLTHAAFVVGDPKVLGTDPNSDARKLAKLALAQGDSISTPQLHKASGWTLRQFNPALRVLLEHVSDMHISGEINPDYPARFFMLDASERHALKLFSTDHDF